MPFIARNLNVLAYANGFTLWHYTTGDTQTTVGRAGYFGAAEGLLRPGDVIVANSTTSKNITTAVHAIVKDTEGKIVARDLLRAISKAA